MQLNLQHRIMNSLSKKKSTSVPADKPSVKKSGHSRTNSKTDNETKAKRSLSKEQIKSTIKKIICKENVSFSNKESKSKQKIGHSRKFNSNLEIVIPNARVSVTPKGLNCTISKDRHVQSTKAADSHKIFTNSGRYNLKQLFESRNNPKDSYKQHDEIPETKIKKSGNLEDRNVDEATIKINHNKDDDINLQEILTKEEINKFGDRFPSKFKRIALLGRGGFSVVWLGVHRASKRKVAIKQTLSQNPHETHLKEMWFGSYFFDKGGVPREEFESHIGIDNICRLFSYEIKPIDCWLYYEVCGEALGSCLFDIKSQMINGQKSYRVHYKQLTRSMKHDVNELKVLIAEVAKALYLINSHNIVHSDLKTENILVKVGKKEHDSDTMIKSVKLIDFGSSFLFTNLKQFSMATPEYMPPEILNYILYQNKLEYDAGMLEKMKKYQNPWTVDVWSLGCIILQIVSGVPLWMSVETTIEDTKTTAFGLFAAKGRLFNKIIQKQIATVESLSLVLAKQNHSGIVLDKQLKQLLRKMLHLQPQLRISPYQILKGLGINCEPHKVPFY